MCLFIWSCLSYGVGQKKRENPCSQQHKQEKIRSISCPIAMRVAFNLSDQRAQIPVQQITDMASKSPLVASNLSRTAFWSILLSLFSDCYTKPRNYLDVSPTKQSCGNRWETYCSIIVRTDHAKTFPYQMSLKTNGKKKQIFCEDYAVFLREQNFVFTFFHKVFPASAKQSPSFKVWLCLQNKCH